MSSMDIKAENAKNRIRVKRGKSQVMVSCAAWTGLGWGAGVVKG